MRYYYMLFYWIFFFSSNVLYAQKKYQSNLFAGTWMNIGYYNQLMHADADSINKDVIPRIIYIDLFGRITVEYRFEQIGKSKLIPKAKKNNFIY